MELLHAPHFWFNPSKSLFQAKKVDTDLHWFTLVYIRLPPPMSKIQEELAAEKSWQLRNKTTRLLKPIYPLLSWISRIHNQLFSLLIALKWNAC
jgi:hypothetical protein